MSIIKTISLKQIAPDPNNPRQEFDPSMLRELQDSIKTHGIMSPLVVEKTKNDNKYLLIDGERRYRASKTLKLEEIPVIIMEALSVTERLIKRVHIQEQNKNWTIFEKALAVKTLKDETGYSTSVLATTLGYNQGTIKNYLLVSSLSKRTATNIRAMKLPFEWVTEIASCNRYVEDIELSEPLQLALIEKASKGIIKKPCKIRYYRDAIKAKGNKITKKIISNKNYTPQQALEDSDLKIEPLFRTLYSNVTFSTRHMNDLIALGKRNKKDVIIPASLHFMCRKLIPVLNNFLKIEIKY